MKRVSKIVKLVKESVSAIASPTISTATTIIAGPVGGIAGTVFGEFCQRVLTHKERNRANKLRDLINVKFAEMQKRGAQSTRDFKDSKFNERYEEIVEGTLQVATKSYEEKKLTLLAELIVRAEFTNTPIDNLHQTLIYAEQLSYRQLCIISVLGQIEHGWLKSRTSDFSNELKNDYSEELIGVLSDIKYLMNMDFIFQEGHMLVPLGNIMHTPIHLTYIGTLLFNGMSLGTLPKEELAKLINILCHRE